MFKADKWEYAREYESRRKKPGNDTLSIMFRAEDVLVH